MRELERDPTEISAPEALPPIALIGRGRVGGSLAAAATASGLAATLVSLEHFEASPPAAGVVLLCVPDDAIAMTAERIRALVPDLSLIGHVSGAATLDQLGPPIDTTSRCSFHPLQTMPDANTGLLGTPVAISADDERSRVRLERLATTLGMRPFDVPEDARAAYHAAASIASNFLVALEESAVELLDAAQVPDGRALLRPLVERTLDNWTELGADALTGPIARGDKGTVARHREAIERFLPELASTYEVMAERTRAVSRTGGTIAEEAPA